VVTDARAYSGVWKKPGTMNALTRISDASVSSAT
jgi:hypothetical protein